MSNVQILKNQSHVDINELSHQYVFIDTNFLIDAFLYGSQFNEILTIIRRSDCTLLSIDAVLFEFTKGSKSLIDNRKKLTDFRRFYLYCYV
jgi:hypothetical protein